MAQRLSTAVLLTAVVLGVHACVGRTVGDQLERVRHAAQVPPRMTVTYAHTLKPTPPPPPVAQPTPPPAEPPPPPKPRATTTPVHIPAVAADGPTAAASAPDVSTAAPLPSASSPAQPEPPAPPPALPPPSPENASPAPAVPVFRWPSATRLRYQLGGQYRGELHGNAQVEWIRQGDHYQVFMDVGSGILFERHMRSEGRITDTGLAPMRYDQESKTFLQDPRRLRMQFDADSVVLANGQRVTTLPGVQDTASQFVQLTYLFRKNPERLQPGVEIEVPLALPGHVNTWIYEVMQAEQLDTPLGPIETFQLKPRRAQARRNDLTAEIWIAPSLQYLPVRIRIVQDENIYLDLLIAQPPDVSEAE